MIYPLIKFLPLLALTDLDDAATAILLDTDDYAVASVSAAAADTTALVPPVLLTTESVALVPHIITISRIYR